MLFFFAPLSLHTSFLSIQLFLHLDDETFLIYLFSQCPNEEADYLESLDLSEAVWYRYEIFNYIGKKDINGNKIYADCSIVQMEWKDNRYSKAKKEYGYFSENKEKHCLEFIIIANCKQVKKINFVNHIDFILSLKIIDTIQKNKLGLIK